VSDRCHCIDPERHGHLDECSFAEAALLRALLWRAQEIAEWHAQDNDECGDLARGLLRDIEAAIGEVE
jgi:hypothetical protein